MRVELTIGGMTCANCARTVDRQLSALPGVSGVQVDLQSGSAVIEYDASKAQPADFAAAVENLGYTAQAK